MPSSHLKRAERAIAAIRHHGELPPEIVEALEAIVSAIRTVDRSVVMLGGNGISPPTAPNGIHLLDYDGEHAKQIRALLGERQPQLAGTEGGNTHEGN
jgi:hypothetical protein